MKTLFKYLLIAVCASGFAQVPGTRPVVKSVVWQQFADAPSSPTIGEEYKDTDGKKYEWNGSTWLVPIGRPETASVTNVMLANMATQTVKGRTTAGTGAPEDLTATQLTAMLNPVTSALKGLAPASGGGTTNFLRADGTWAAPPGGGGIGSANQTLTGNREIDINGNTLLLKNEFSEYMSITPSARALLGVWTFPFDAIVTNNIIDLAVTTPKIAPGINGQVLTTVSGNTVWGDLSVAASNVSFANSGTGLAGTTAQTAIAELADNATEYIESDITGLTGATKYNNIVAITQAGFNAIGTPDANTRYDIIDAPVYRYPGTYLSDLTTNITTGTSRGLIPIFQAGFITDVHASLLIASSSGAVTVDVLKNGTTILSTKITIDVGGTSDLTAATPPVISGGSVAVAPGDRITFNIDTAGTGAKGLVGTLEIDIN